MRSRTSFILFGLLGGTAFVHGCSSGSHGGLAATSGTSGGIGAAAGTTGAAGSSSAGSSSAAAGAGGSAGAGPDGGSGAAGVDAGLAGSIGTAGADAGPDAAGAGAAGTGDAGGAGAGGAAAVDLTKIVPTPGCGMDPAGFTPGTLVRFTMSTSGMKDVPCADQKCGAWGPWIREYYVKLPTGYDMTKAYPILFAGPGCGAHGNNMYPLPGLASTIILVGLTPSEDAQAGHATNPGQGCFDDKEGDDSVDWVFYENLYDKLASTLCFDRNRVFAGGDSSGAWFANELGCKYAGDPTRPVRGIMANTGGLPTDPRYVPTCTTKPMAGLWSQDIADPTNPFTGNIVAMNRALRVNGCTPAGVAYATATFAPFPLANGDATSCKRYQGCPDLSPLVVCPLQTNDRYSGSPVVNPGWEAFIKLFLAPPLLTP